MEATYVIPKEELSSWQKWEFNALDTFKTLQKTEPPGQAQQPPKPVTEPGKQETISLPTAEQIEHIYQQARQEGAQTGYQEGKLEAAQEIEAEIKSLKMLMNNFEQALRQIDQTLAQDLLALSIDLANKMVGEALRIKPELILPTVEKALQQLPAVTQTLRLTLHPGDAAHVREYLENRLAHSQWRILEDTQIEPGGCRVETGGCEVDATLTTRWQRVLAALGQEPNWLA